MDLERLEGLFHRGLDLPETEREAFLERECAGDAELAGKLRDLLNRSTGPGSCGGASLDPFVKRDEIGDQSTLVGRSIGGYDIESVLASGGMGTVFKAVQHTTNRPVALKILKPELLGPSFVRRFSLEIEVLGRLHDPNIAEIYGGGTETLFGAAIPYFAMELVPNARPLHKFAAEKPMDVETALRLFLKVCGAITHAHLQGVIHRDLKSENILVDGGAADPEPKVIDFGIARIDKHGGTTLTMAGQVVGSLETMSPEQARGAAGEIDNRTDVYSLGVVLYQMLTGRAPLRTREMSIPEAMRTVAEVQPERPSKLRAGIRPDLDAIVLKCLAKERGDRYDSVLRLQEDIEAYLDGRTVSARAPRTVDVMRIALRRYRAALIPAGVVFLAAIVAALVSTRFAIQAAERDRDVRRVAYRTSMNAAAASLADAEFPVAQRFLDEAPPELRGWEWEHVASRLSQKPSPIGEELGEIWHGGFAISPDGRYYVTAADGDSLVRLCLADTGTLVRGFPAGGTVVLIGFDDATRVIAQVRTEGGGTFHRWSIDGRDHETWPAPPEATPDASTRFGAHTSAGGLFAVNFDSRLRVYSTSVRRMVFSEPVRGRPMHSTFDGDGRRLASCQRREGGEFIVVVYDVGTWRRTHELVGPTDVVNDMAFSSDGRLLIAAGADGGVYQWDLETGESQPARILGRSREPSFYVALSSDGLTAAASGADAKIRYWDLETGLLRGTIGMDPALTGGMAFRPGTRMLYAIASRRPARVWELSGEDATVVARHASYAYPVEISERSGMLLTGGWDGYVGESGCLRWSDLATGEPIASLGPKGAVVLDADLSPDETEALVAIYTPESTGKRDETAIETDARSSPLVAPALSGRVARISMISGEALAVYAYPRTVNYLAPSPSLPSSLVERS